MMETTPPVRNALTFDIEEHFHALNLETAYPRCTWDQQPLRARKTLDHLLELLDDANTKATFFVLGWLAERSPDIVHKIDEAGHEVACHGYSHRVVTTQGPKEFYEETRRARDILSDLTGKAVRGYRASCFSITLDSAWALDALIELGFHYDSSVSPVVRERCGIAGSPTSIYQIARPSGRSIIEVPPTVLKLGGQRLPVGGGGFFRLFPYGLTRWGLRRVNREGRPANVYLHPWEFDPEQPRANITGLHGFRHYVGLKNTSRKLQLLLEDFHFAPLCEVIDEAFVKSGTSVLTT